MPQAVWVGELGFGLVNIPVRLFTATSSKRVRFHQYEAGTGRRIRYRRVAEGVAPAEPDVSAEPDVPAEPVVPAERAVPADAADPTEVDDFPRPLGDTSPSEEPSQPADETEVAWEGIVRGYEVEPGRVVTVAPDDLEAVAPERTRVLEVERFVDLAEIDPVFYERSYYVVPQRSTTAERAYWLLHRAMEDAGKAAIGRFVMRTKEYLVAVRPGDHALMLETLFYADEVRDPKELWIPPAAEPTERELRLARGFIDALAAGWDPERHRDEHRERLLDLIYSRLDEAVAVPESPDEAPVSPVTDLLEALQASVEAAKQARAAEGRRTG